MVLYFWNFDSSAVEQMAVNHSVVSSNLTQSELIYFYSYPLRLDFIFKFGFESRKE